MTRSPSPRSPSARPLTSRLIRGIGRWDLVALVVNGTIGAGIFGLPSRVFALSGTYSLIAFVLCAFLAALIVMCFAEVGSRFEKTGGASLYASTAFGPTAGFAVGWLMWIQRLTGFAALSNLIVAYLGFFWQPAATGIYRAAAITAVAAFLAIVNVRGIRETALLSDMFTIAKLLPICLFIVAGLFFIDPQRYTVTPASYSNMSASILLLIYAFAGFDVAGIPAGEMREPRKNLPFAMFTAQAVVTVIYLLIQVVCIGTLPGLAASDRPLADASEKFLGPAGSSVIAAGAMIAALGTLLTTMLAAPRILFSLAEQRQIPTLFSAIHDRFRTPHVAILFSSAAMLAVALSGTFIYAVTINAMIRLCTYVVTCGALWALRRRTDVPPPVFKVPAGNLVAGATLALCVWLLSHATWREFRDLGVALAVGLLIYFCNHLRHRGSLSVR
jgi:APA family basic amino acid/polyamine antiporter